MSSKKNKKKNNKNQGTIHLYNERRRRKINPFNLNDALSLLPHQPITK